MGLDDPIFIVEYDPRWPECFDAQAQAIRAALGQSLSAVHHIGSTAVPGMPAKPVIDMLAEVSIAVDDPQIDVALRGQGFINQGEFGIPGRIFFRREGAPPVHLHVFPAGHPSVRRDLGFRDKLREEANLRDMYATMKRALAGSHREDRPAYSRGKESFILDAAGPRPAARWQ